MHASWGDDRGISTEGGIVEMDEREKSSRLKVASHLSDYLEERRFYHRKDGQIVKIKDDLMSAARVAIMMNSIGARCRARRQGCPARKRRVASGMDFDPFTGR